MILKREIILSQLDDGYVAVAAEEARDFFHGMIKLNETGAFITECLKEETTVSEIVKSICEKYDVTEEKALYDVEKIVKTYRDMGLLVE